MPLKDREQTQKLVKGHQQQPRNNEPHRKNNLQVTKR